MNSKTHLGFFILLTEPTSMVSDIIYIITIHSIYTYHCCLPLFKHILAYYISPLHTHKNCSFIDLTVTLLYLHINYKSWVTKWQHSTLIFRRCSVWILTGAPAILMDLFCGIPQSLQANDRIVPWLNHECFLPNPFQFIIHQSPYHSMIHSLRYWQCHKYTTK
jgi:hypothetical protein